MRNVGECSGVRCAGGVQAAAARLAMCDDIGEAAYTTSLVATAMLMRFQYLQGAPD